MASDDAFGDALNALLLASKKVQTTASEQTANQDNVSLLARSIPCLGCVNPLDRASCSLRPCERSLIGVSSLALPCCCASNLRVAGQAVGSTGGDEALLPDEIETAFGDTGVALANLADSDDCGRLK